MPHTQNCKQARTPATIKNRLSLLKAACRWAWRYHKLTKDDPTLSLFMPLVRNARTVYPKQDLVDKFIELALTANHHDLARLIQIAFYSGMRLGEILSVKINAEGDFALEDTKNGDKRIVPVHPKLQSVIQHLPLKTNRNALYHQWRKVRRASGFPDVRFHDLRHGAASEMVNAGVNLADVGAILGHRDPRTTLRYAHHSRETLKAAISKVGMTKGSS